MAFYNPFVTEVGRNHVIVYPDEEIVSLINRGRSNIEAHLRALWMNNPLTSTSRLGQTDYQIDFIWAHQGDIMADIWTFAELGRWPSGPLADDPKIFRGFSRDTNIGVGSGNTLIVLGREEELRRSYGDDNLLAYLTGRRAELPKGLLLNKDF